ncbi:hypothetical protein B0H17DRAFT_1196429 [Mycena rosella]|uniref:Uncharacterized protein n=1 Tax=Mycena rosella TaxID=1033263 RepID=A0AAD7DUP5_MYCRO|nr:hypothetical protein B0H17DRAFT_1196429 [Mycena rosella]
MADHRLDAIWSKYTKSPDPLSGMDSLYRACSKVLEHVLQPSDIPLTVGGFTLSPSLAALLREIIPAVDHLLSLAAQCHGLQNAPCIGQVELQVLTNTKGLHCATQHQIICNWVVLLNHLWAAMREMKCMCIYGDPRSSSHLNQPSRIPRITASLPLSLRVKIPESFLDSFGIPASSRDVDVLRLCPEAPARKVQTSTHASLAAAAAPMTCGMDMGIQEPGGQQRLVGALAESTHVRPVRLRTEDIPSSSCNDHPLRSTTAYPSRDCHSSVKALVAAIKARERAPVGPVMQRIDETCSERAQVSMLVDALCKAVLTDAARSEGASVEAAQRSAEKRVEHPRTSESKIFPTISASRVGCTVPISTAAASMASSSFPAPGFVNHEDKVELGGLDDKDLSIQAELIALIQHSASLTAQRLVKNVTMPGPCSAPSKACAAQRVKMAAPIPGGRSKSRLRDFAFQVAEVVPSLGVLKSSALAVVKNEAIERGGLKGSRQQHVIPGMEICTSGKSSRASGSAQVPVAMHDTSALERTEFPSPAPALTVELGGIGDMDQELAISYSETRTFDKHGGTSKEYHTLAFPASVLPSSAWSPTPTLVSDEATVELGGPQPLLPPRNQQLAKAEAASILTSNTRAFFASESLSPSALPSASATGVIALVSALIRTVWVSYLRLILLDIETTAQLVWEREGIGTRTRN